MSEEECRVHIQIRNTLGFLSEVEQQLSMVNVKGHCVVGFQKPHATSSIFLNQCNFI